MRSAYRAVLSLARDHAANMTAALRRALPDLSRTDPIFRTRHPLKMLAGEYRGKVATFMRLSRRGGFFIE
jgi:hypothetical protein